MAVALALACSLPGFLSTLPSASPTSLPSKGPASHRGTSACLSGKSCPLRFRAQVESAPQSSPGSALQLSSKAEDRNTTAAALLCGDPTIGYPLGNGTTTLLVSLAKVENIDSISFVNRDAKGEVTMATSNAKLPADSPQWQEIARHDLTSDTISAKIGPSEAKYIRLTFNITEPGRIADLGIYSTPTVAAFAIPHVRKPISNRSEGLSLVSYNLTDVHAKARAAYVSSGDDVKQANNTIDDQPSTSYQFAASDSAPMAIIDLGKPTKLRRISALYSPARGTLDFYVLQSLPGAAKGVSPTDLKLDEATLAGLQPVGSFTDTAGTGRAAIDFPETTGRYVMVKWTPAEQGAPFAIAEIAAFGGGEPETLVASRENAERSDADGKTILEGKDFKDLGEGKEMPEEGPPGEGPGPELPDPPPFVFVPEVLPQSP